VKHRDPDPARVLPPDSHAEDDTVARKALTGRLYFVPPPGSLKGGTALGQHLL